MALTLAKATRYLADPNNLYQQFKKGSFTTDLEVMNQFSIDDAGAVKVQSNSVTGESQDYNGYGSVSTNAADVIKANTGWIIYMLDQKRYYPMPIDKIEAEESLNNFIGRVNFLMKHKVAADIDTYRLSKLSYQAGTVIDGAAGMTGDLAADLVGTGTDLNKTNILNTIETCAAKMSEEEVTVDNYFMYTTPAVIRILEDADKLTRFINSREVEKDGIGYKIKYIETGNGRVDIINIPTKYFHLFSMPATPPTQANQAGLNQNKVLGLDTGFRFLLVARPAINAVVKVNEARIIPSGIIRGFLGDLFELFLYHDIFIIDRREAVGTIDADFLTGKAFNGVIKCALA